MITILKPGLYDVKFSGESFTVTVAKSCYKVRQWIQVTYASGLMRELVAGFAVQWRKNLPADVLQICVGERVLLVQLRFFRKLPTELKSFLLMKRGVVFYGIGVGSYRDKLLGSRMKVKTKFILDLRKCLSDHDGKNLQGASLARLLNAGSISDDAVLNSLQDHDLASSDWGRSDLRQNQILHASFRAICACRLGRLAKGQAQQQQIGA